MSIKRKFLIGFLALFTFLGTFAGFSKSADAASTYQPYLDTEFLDSHLTVDKSGSNKGLFDFSAYTNKKSNWLYEYSHTATLHRVLNGKVTQIFNKKFTSSAQYTNYLGKGDYVIVVKSTLRNKVTGKKVSVHNQATFVLK